MSKPINPWKLPGYKAGQNVTCKVMAAEPGGYAILIPKDNLPGFLPTEQKLKIGEEVLAQYVCVHNNRILVSSRFSGMSAQPSSERTYQQVNWEEHLRDPSLEGKSASPTASAESQAEAAFRVWADATTPRFHLKRAIDLIMPPLKEDDARRFTIGEYDLEWLLTDIEGGMRTGCLKASSNERLSRMAILLYRGRAVGCIYGCKSMNDTQSTEQALAFALNDLKLPNTEVTLYDMPEDVTLAMSALFMGYPVQQTHSLDARSYADYLFSWFSQKGQTACLAVSLPSKAATALAFVHAGEFCGSFYVEDQTYAPERQSLDDLFASDNQATVEATILPPEMISPAVRYGYSLSMVLKKQVQ